MQQQKVAEIVVGVDTLVPIGPGARFVAADEEALPLADASLDLAVSALALAMGQRSAGNAGADPARIEAGWVVSCRASRWRHVDRVAAIVRGSGSGDRRRRVAACRAVCGYARRRRIAAAGRLCIAGGRCRSPDRALRYAVRPDAGSAWHGRDQCPASNAAARRSSARRCNAWRKSMPSASAIPTDACARRSTLCGYRDGRRMKASSSPCGRVQQKSRLADALKTTEFPAGEKSGGD